MNGRRVMTSDRRSVRSVMDPSSSITVKGGGSGIRKLAANVGLSSKCPDCEIFSLRRSGAITSARNFSSPTPSRTPRLVFSTNTTSPRGMNCELFIVSPRTRMDAFVSCAFRYFHG